MATLAFGPPPLQITMIQGLVYSLLFTSLLLLVPTTALDCNTSSFTALATTPAVALCLQRTNISIFMLQASPTQSQLTMVCETPPCREILASLVQLNLSECTVPFGGRLRLHADLIEPTIAFCANPHTRASASDNVHEPSKYGNNASGASLPTNESSPTVAPASSSLANRPVAPTSLMVLSMFCGVMLG